MSALPNLDALTYRRHWLHDDERDWPETNCYVDLWVELLHAFELEPLASLAFTVECGFDGEQWEFFKHQPDDLRDLYGIAVREINVWRSLPEHIEGQLALGNLLTVEVDAFHLPDTAGVSYGIGHQKTSIVPYAIDHSAERLSYFHNRGYHQLDGGDFRAVLRLDAPAASLPPYVELVDLGRLVRRSADELHAVAAGHVRMHLARRAPGNPVAALATRMQADLPWLRANPERFHDYAFGTLRQLGAWASTASAFVQWLDGSSAAPVVAALDTMSTTAKTCQFKMARVVAGRDVDLSELFDRMIAAWDTAFDALESAHGG